MSLSLSIIIPAYNVEKWIGECLDSIVGIPRDDFEVIVVNDGSTDGTKEVIESYQNSFHHFRVLDQVNQGASVARNYGLSIARGEYIFFCDSDDYVLPSIFNEFLEETIKSNAEIGIANGRNLFGNEIKGLMKKADFISTLGLVDGPTFYIKANEKSEFNISPCLRLYKLNFLKDNNLNFIPSIMHEDEEFGPKIFALAKRVIYFDKYFYIRRHRLESVTKNKRHKYHNAKSIKSFIVVLKEFASLLNIHNWSSLQLLVIKHAFHKSYIEILRRELYFAKEGISEFRVSTNEMHEIKKMVNKNSFSFKQKWDILRIKMKISYYIWIKIISRPNKNSPKKF